MGSETLQKKEGVSKFTPSFKISQSPNFHKLGLCYSIIFFWYLYGKKFLICQRYNYSQSKQRIFGFFSSRIDEDIADDAPVRIIDHVLDKIDISNILKLYHVKGRNAFIPV